MTDDLIERTKFQTDDHVWIGLEAGRAEANRWRIMDFNGRGVIAVNDLRPLEFTPPSAGPADLTYERHDFADRETALKYIEWRAYKAALEAAIAIIAPAVLAMAAQTAIDPSDESSYLVADAILALKAQFEGDKP